MACILVVENDPDTREILREILSEQGHTVRIAENGAEALRHLTSEEEVPSVVVVDNWMPLMSGEQFLDWLAAQPRFDRIHAIVASGDGLPFRHRRAAAVLRKPYDVDDLLDAVRKFCSQEQQAGAPSLTGFSPAT